MEIREIREGIRKGDITAAAETTGCSVKLVERILNGDITSHTKKGTKGFYAIEYLKQLIIFRNSIKSSRTK